jgi:3-deoxy-D-manno-octulosonic-acid transferase
MENFAILTQTLVARNGAMQVRDADELERRLDYLLGDKDARSRLVENAKAVLSKHRGASARTARLIDGIASPLRDPPG